MCRVLAFCALVALCSCSPRFEKPRAERPIVLPRDHARMSGFKTEWWYWNGHLGTPGGRKLDFFLSFTRHDTRGDRWLGIPLFWLPREVHLGMFGLTDRGAGKHAVAARSSVPDFWAANAEAGRPWIYHDSWAAQWVHGKFYVTARARGAELHLVLTPQKPAALYGEGGYVEQGGSPHYVYSYTRMAVSGAIIEDGRSEPVEGIAWFDHFVGHPSDASARSWDWLSLQLSDGTDYMLAQLRDERGRTTPYASFAVDASGRVQALAPDSVRWKLRRTWRSERSNDEYRLYWTLEAPGMTLEIEPVLDDQEIHRAPVKRLWEGSVRIRGTRNGRMVTGEGFLETVAAGGLPTGGMSFGR